MWPNTESLGWPITRCRVQSLSPLGKVCPTVVPRVLLADFVKVSAVGQPWDTIPVPQPGTGTQPQTRIFGFGHSPHWGKCVPVC